MLRLNDECSVYGVKFECVSTIVAGYLFILKINVYQAGVEVFRTRIKKKKNEYRYI